MTAEEFAKKIKATKFIKLTGDSHTRGYAVRVPTEDGKCWSLTFFIAPDQLGKRAYPDCYNKALARIAERLGYNGSLARWRK